MGLESATYISDLVPANPVGATDPKSQGDDHIRLIKEVLRSTFPNMDEALTALPEALNGLGAAGGTVAASAGWTLNESYNCKLTDKLAYLHVKATRSGGNLAFNAGTSVPIATATLTTAGGMLTFFGACNASVNNTLTAATGALANTFVYANMFAAGTFHNGDIVYVDLLYRWA